MASAVGSDPDVRQRDAPPGHRFESLFHSHARSLLGYALRRVDVAEDAADVVAETFLVAWRRVEAVPDGDEARLWLYGVARRVLANHSRGAGRRHRLAKRLREELAAHAPEQPDHERAERVAVVRDAMRALHDDDRELLRLTSWEGLTPAELATVLGIPPATVRTRLHRARGRLRTELASMGVLGERVELSGHVSGDGHRPVSHEEDR